MDNQLNLVKEPILKGKPFPSETILEDDYPIYANYFYLADGVVVCSPYHAVTAKYFKLQFGIKELRRCSLADRNLL